jgi:hypothetical protein
VEDQHIFELGVASLDGPTTELSEVRELAEHWWPGEPAEQIAAVSEATVRWLLDEGYATLDAGNFSEPAPVPDERVDTVLGDPISWRDSMDMRMFVRATPAGTARYQNRGSWPAGYRERMDRIEQRNAMIDPARLAAELAARLVPLAPADYRVGGNGATLELMRGPYGTGYDLEEALGWQRSDEFALHDVIRQVLENAQEEFTEAQFLPWPTNTTSYLGRVFADPDVEERDGHIHMWFGPAAQPAVVLEPIPVETIIRTAE